MQPSIQPSSTPSSQPSRQPSCSPTSQPSAQPSVQPWSQPSGSPSSRPTNPPSTMPSSQPTSQPSSRPTSQPSARPTRQPSSQPFVNPTCEPTPQPSNQPIGYPSYQPSAFPSIQPTSVPTHYPSESPSDQPTSFPSSQPSNQPTTLPSTLPSSQPTGRPSSQPTMIPTSQPTIQPTSIPSDQPTALPSIQPSSYPTSQPTSCPSCQPTSQPTFKPTTQPTGFPSSQPSKKPSDQPTSKPSSQPSATPTVQPSQQPSSQPTCNPTCQPSSGPSCQPTVIPSDQPTSSPTEQPLSLPTCIPSAQPSNCPTKQPISTPTSIPSTQPTIIPTAQPFSFPTSAPQATIYQTNGVLFYLGATSGVNKTHNNDMLGTSYILFGRNFKHQGRFPLTISLDSLSSRESVSQITNNEAGIRNDITIRSTTIVGDINGDTFLDLLVGYPLASKCSVYLGDGVTDFATIITTTGESFAIVGDPYQGGGFLGWSSVRIGDLNGDGLEEIVVSAIYANTIYVIYGRKEFQKTININELTNKDGFQIKGSNQETNFGVGLSLLHHFRKGSHADIAVTAQRSIGGQSVVYVLFGGALFKNPEGIIAVDQIMNNPRVVLKIIAPLYSFAGFSVAGIGDINSDGNDDLAIGSVPYYRGKYHEQKTYIIYGRKFVENETILEISQITSEDGIIITGGGFLVTGVGDVNADSVADVMISSYYDWKGQKSAYLISTPANMTYSPSFQPSSSPTMIPTVTPTNSSLKFTVNDNFTFSSTKLPSFRPSYIPAQFNRSLTPTRVVYAIGTSRPSNGIPSLAPSLTPISGYFRLRGFPTITPALTPTMMPTINTTVFTEVDCSGEKEYQGQNGTHYLFRITANTGTVKINGNDEGGAKNIFVLYCPSDRVNVILKNFRLSTDIISVAHLINAGFSYPSLNEISYSLKSGQPLTLLFCSENKLQVILSSYTSFVLQERNFLFTQILDNEMRSKQSIYGNSVLVQAQIGVVGAVFVLLILIFWALSYQNKQVEKEQFKQEEAWLNSLKVPIESHLDICPAYKTYGQNDQESQQIQENSVSSNPTLVANINISRDILGNGQQSSAFSSSASSYSSSFEIRTVSLTQRAMNGVIYSINSDDWQDALATSDDDNDEQQLQEQPVSWVALSGDTALLTEMFQNSREYSGPSSSSSSSSEEGSQISFHIFAVEYDEIWEEIENMNDDDISGINSDEWEDALAPSDDEEEA
jgi:hypothetical protein